MSKVQIDYNVKIGTGNGLAMDTWLAKQAFKWCKEQYPWFAEACEKSQIALEGNKIVSSGFSIPCEDDSKIFDWTEGVYKQFKPAQLSVRNVVHSTDNDGKYNPRSACFYIANAEADATAPAAYKFRRLMDIRFGKFDCVTESGETREYYYQMVDSQEAFLLGRNFLEEKNPHNVALCFKKDERTTSEVVEIWPLSTLKMDEDTLADKMDRRGIKTEDAIIKDEFFLAVGGYHAMPLLDSEGNPVSMLEAMDVQKTFAGTRYEDWTFEGIEYEFGKVEPLVPVKAAKKKVEPKQAKESTAAKKKTTRKKKIEVAEEKSINFGTFTDDRDGHVYKTVKIGDQEWLAENFAYECEGSCAYGNDESLVATYGRHYTWNAAKSCVPKGWHLPSKDEYEKLIAFVAKEHGEGGEGTALKSPKKWAKPIMFEKLPKGTDDYGFGALPGGFGCVDDGYYFYEMDETARFWTSSEEDSDMAVQYTLSSEAENMCDGVGEKRFSLSVRLVRDEK